MTTQGEEVLKAQAPSSWQKAGRARGWGSLSTVCPAAVRVVLVLGRLQFTGERHFGDTCAVHWRKPVGHPHRALGAELGFPRAVGKVRQGRPLLDHPASLFSPPALPLLSPPRGMDGPRGSTWEGAWSRPSEGRGGGRLRVEGRALCHELYKHGLIESSQL